MTSYGKLLSDIWTNRDFNALNPQEQQLYMLLLSYPTCNHAGVLPLTLRRWAKATATATPDSVHTALLRLAAARFVVLDWETEEVLVRTFIRNDEVYRQPRLMKCALREALETASPVLRAALSDELRRLPEHTDDKATLDAANALVATPDDTPDDTPGDTHDEGYVDSQGVGSYVSRVRVAPENPTPENPTPTPAPENPELARPLDRMGRPSMSLTRQTGGIEQTPEPPPPDRGITEETRAVVHAHVPTTMLQSKPTRRGLYERTQELFNNGADSVGIGRALDRLVTRIASGEDLYPGHLPHIHSQLMAEQDITPEQRRNGHRLSTGDRQFQELQAMKDPPLSSRKELI